MRVARFVGIEVCFDNGRERRQLLHLAVVEQLGSNEEPVDLGDRQVSLVERLGYPAALPKQPTWRFE